MPHGAWETRLGKWLRACYPATTPRPSASGSKQPTPKHGPLAPPGSTTNPQAEHRERRAQKGRSAAKGQGTAQSEGSTSKGEGAPGTPQEGGTTVTTQGGPTPGGGKGSGHNARVGERHKNSNQGKHPWKGDALNRRDRHRPTLAHRVSADQPTTRNPLHSERERALAQPPSHEGTGTRKGQPQGHTPAMPGKRAHPDPAPTRAGSTTPSHSHQPPASAQVERGPGTKADTERGLPQPKPPHPNYQATAPAALHWSSHHRDTGAVTPGEGRGKGHNTGNGQRHEGREKDEHPGEENKPSHWGRHHPTPPGQPHPKGRRPPRRARNNTTPRQRPPGKATQWSHACRSRRAGPTRPAISLTKRSTSTTPEHTRPPPASWITQARTEPPHEAVTVKPQA